MSGPCQQSDGSTTAGTSFIDTPRSSFVSETDDNFLMSMRAKHHIRAKLQHLNAKDRRDCEISFVKKTDNPCSSTWFLVPLSWLASWKSYLRQELVQPGPINTDELVDSQGLLRQGLQPCHDYRGLSCLQWLFLSSLHGGGPALKVFNVDVNGVVQGDGSDLGRCHGVGKCRVPRCIDCDASRDARSLLGLHATGPVPDIMNDVVSLILCEKESEVFFTRLLASPRLGELQTMAAAHHGDEIRSLIAEIKDKQIQQVCNDRINDFKAALECKIKLGSAKTDPIACVIGAASAANQKAMMRSVVALDSTVTAMHNTVNVLKRKITFESPTPSRARLQEVEPLDMDFAA